MRVEGLRADGCVIILELSGTATNKNTIGATCQSSKPDIGSGRKSFSKEVRIVKVIEGHLLKNDYRILQGY